MKALNTHSSTLGLFLLLLALTENEDGESLVKADIISTSRPLHINLPNGTEHQRFTMLPHTLHQSLELFMRPNESITVWITAVCFCFCRRGEKLRTAAEADVEGFGEGER